MTREICIALFFLLFAQVSHAQWDRTSISIGVGPSMIYGDNTGIHEEFLFTVRPAVSMAFNYQLAEKFDVRATLGSQWIDSGEFDNFNLRREWASGGHTSGFTGAAYYFDVMPIYQFNPRITKSRNFISYYGGVGVGVIQITRKEERLIGDISQLHTNYRGSEINLHLPVRMGIHLNLESYWDMAFEFTGIATSTEFDGNDVGKNVFGPDILGQVQLVLIGYIWR